MKDWRNAISDEDPEPDYDADEVDLEGFRQFVHHVLPDDTDDGEVDGEAVEGDFLNVTSTHADADVRCADEPAASGVAGDSTGSTGVDDSHQDYSPDKRGSETGKSYPVDSGSDVVCDANVRAQVEYDSCD